MLTAAELEALVERACTAAVERAYKCPGASVCCNPSWCKTASKCMRLEDERMRPKPVAWRDNEGLLETVETLGNLTSVIRGAGYRPEDHDALQDAWAEQHAADTEDAAAKPDQMRAYAAEAVEAERKRHMNPARLADAAMTFAVYEVADENRTAGELIAAMRVIFGNALIDAMIRARSKTCKP